MADEEDPTSKSVPGFAFVEANLDTPAECAVFHPLQHEKRAFYSSKFAELRVEAVLAGVAGELAEDEGGGDCWMEDGKQQNGGRKNLSD